MEARSGRRGRAGGSGPKGRAVLLVQTKGTVRLCSGKQRGAMMCVSCEVGEGEGNDDGGRKRRMNVEQQPEKARQTFPIAPPPVWLHTHSNTLLPSLHCHLHSHPSTHSHCLSSYA